MQTSRGKLLDRIKTYDGYIQKFFEKDYEGSCPCFSGKRTEGGKSVNVRGRCWRVSEFAQDLYVWGDHPDLKKIGRAIKKNLDDQEWYNPYTIIWKNPNADQ